MATEAAGSKKPALVIVIGIATIVFCLATGMFLISDIVSNASIMRRIVEPSILSEGRSADALYDGIVKASGEYGRLLRILDLIKAAIAAIGLAGGILLLLSKRTGEILMITYAFTGVAALAISIVFNIFFAAEERVVLQGFFQAQGLSAGDVESFSARMTDFGSFFWLVVLTNWEVIWPIMVLILMSMKKVREYFRRPGVTVGD